MVIAAMAEEADAFAEFGEPVVAPGHSDHRGRYRHLRIGDHVVALLRSGVGFTNATAAAAYSFHTLGSTVPIINVGTAGGLAASVSVGDVVVGDRYFNLNADATIFGYERGQVPGMPTGYSADLELLDRTIAAGLSTPPSVGTIGSSETFVTETTAEGLRQDFPEVVAVDMESAAIAQFAFSHDVPFISIRAISDLCAPDGAEFLTHLPDAATRAAELAVGIVRSFDRQLAEVPLRS